MTTITLEDVWALFKETDRIIKENAQAAEKRFQETEQLLKEISQEADRRSIEADKRSKETDRKLNKLEYLFTSQWGKLVESLVRGALVKLFNERGIPVQHTLQRARGTHQGNPWEVDIIVKNGHEVIIVEVKTTLRPDDVKDFLKKLPHIKTWLKEYADNTLYGAMAYLSADAGSEQMAQQRGLFVIKATGDSALIENPLDFIPTIY